MPTALWIANATSTDVESYKKYAAIAKDAIAEFNGVLLANNGIYEQLEGNDRDHNFVVRFPSLKAAHDCYYSEEYAKALVYAKASLVRDLVIVEEQE